MCQLHRLGHQKSVIEDVFMRAYYGEKIVAKSEGIVKSENILHHNKKFLLASSKPYNEIELGENETLFYWGKIFAIISKNGKYI